MNFTQIIHYLFVDIHHPQCYDELVKEKEVNIMFEENLSYSIYSVIADYEKYVEAQKEQGKEAVSIIKYAFGKF